MKNLTMEKYNLIIEAKNKGLKGLTIKTDKKNDCLILTVRNLLDQKKVEKFNSYKGLNYFILVKTINKVLCEEIIVEKNEVEKSKLLPNIYIFVGKNRFQVTKNNHREIRHSTQSISSLSFIADECQRVINKNEGEEIEFVKIFKHNILQRMNEIYKKSFVANYK